MFEWLATFRDWLSGGHRTPYIKHIRSYSSTKPTTNRTRKRFVLRRCSFNTLLPLPKALSLCCYSCSKSRIGQQLYFYTHPLNPYTIHIELIGSVRVSVTKRFTRLLYHSPHTYLSRYELRVSSVRNSIPIRVHLRYSSRVVCCGREKKKHTNWPLSPWESFISGLDHISI